MSGTKGAALVVGPGPVTLAQGPGFQYTAARACRVLREMGRRVVALEDNPATLMDAGGVEGGLFLEPPAAEVVERILKRGDIGSIWYGFGGRRGWRLAMNMAGEGWPEEYGVETPDLDDRALWLCGDRSLLRESLEAGGIENTPFHAVGSLREGQDAAERIGFPLVVRPHFSCGGWGAGLAYNLEDYPALLEEAARESLTGEVLVENALDGWHKYVAVVLRDHGGRNCVAGIFEQREPLSIHDEDAVLVYPAQRAGRDGMYALCEMARRVVEILDLTGLAEVKLAAAPGWESLYVVDVNPCPWRIMPLLEAACGRDLLRAHIELVLGGDLAGEIMAMERMIPDCVMVALPDPSSTGEGNGEGYMDLGCRSAGRTLLRGTDAAEAASRGIRYLTRTVCDGGKRARRALEGLLAREGAVSRGMETATGGTGGDNSLPGNVIRLGKGDVRGGIMVLAGENGGPGGGYEANFNCYLALEAWRREGLKAALYTPDPGFAVFASGEAETVFIGPLEEESVYGAMTASGAESLVGHFGGQAAMDVAARMAGFNVQVSGLPSLGDGGRITGALQRARAAGLQVVDFTYRDGPDEGWDTPEEGTFPQLGTAEGAASTTLQKLVYTPGEAAAFAEEVEGRLLWRPLREEAQEVQVEAVGLRDGNIVLLWEQLDAPGIYSTDGLASYPPCYLTSGQSARALELARRVIDALGWTGNLSMRIHICNGDTYLWSVSPGASENLPFLYRASAMPLAAWGMMALNGREAGVHGERGLCSAIRAPVIPYGAIAGSDILPTPQRRSTGAVASLAADPDMALAKALWSQGLRSQPGGRAFLSVANRDKRRAVMLARELASAGYMLMATRGTARALEAAGTRVETVNKLREGRPNILDLIRNGQVGMVVNIPRGKHPHSDGFYIRAASVRHGIPCITNMDVALALARALRFAEPGNWEVLPLEEYGRVVQEIKGG